MILRSPRWSLALLFASTTLLGTAAYVTGGTAFTKRFETKLLAEPVALAPSTAKLGYAVPVKVLEVRGAWLRISGEGKTGWVFNGNLSETKPAESQGLGLPVAASQTTATAAARPLSPAAEDYASRQNLTSARDDLNWLLEQSAAITPDTVTEFLKEQKKGEFQ
jgi:hypothetical protein